MDKQWRFIAVAAVSGEVQQGALILVSTTNTVPVSMHLKLVGKVALITSVVTALVLIIVIAVVSGNGGETYLDRLQSHSITRTNLGSAMLIAGLLLISFVAVVTWLIALYASFRVAGPLFRFCRDLELSPITDKPIGIRKEDYLQDVSKDLLETVETLRMHYKELEAVVCLTADAYAAGNRDKVKDLLAKLNELEGSVHVD